MPEPSSETVAPLRLDLADTANALRLVRNGFVVPPAPVTGTPSRWSASGVLDADGAMVEQSISWSTSTERVNQAPPRPAEARPLAGRYLFGGILYGHFGHFIVESLARLWAQDALGFEADAMIFTPKALTFPDPSVEKLQHLAELLGLRIPILVAREPLQVEELHVPAQGFGMGDLIGGSAAFRAFINTHAGAAIAPMGAEKLYVSRSQLPRDRGSILGEYKLEAYLAAEGYDIFHPQKAKPAEQIARYKAARLVVGVDCSPIHMLGYVGNAGQNTAIILRRSLTVGSFLTQQLRIFKGMQVQDHDLLLDDWIPQPGNRPSRSTWGEIDFPALHARLLASGHVTNPTPWPSLTAEERAAELERVAKLHDTTVLSHREMLAARAAKAAAAAAAKA
jgi:hypothetical protein